MLRTMGWPFSSTSQSVASMQMTMAARKCVWQHPNNALGTAGLHTLVPVDASVGWGTEMLDLWFACYDAQDYSMSAICCWSTCVVCASYLRTLSWECTPWVTLLGYKATTFCCTSLLQPMVIFAGLKYNIKLYKSLQAPPYLCTCWCCDVWVCCPSVLGIRRALLAWPGIVIGPSPYSFT